MAKENLMLMNLTLLKDLVFNVKEKFLKLLKKYTNTELFAPLLLANTQELVC